MPEQRAKTMQVNPPWEAWAGVCRLLGRLWLRELNAPALQQLVQEPLRSHYVEAGGWLPQVESPQELEGWIAPLAEQYCRLFVGPRGHRPPVQSVWQQEQFQGPTAPAMQQWWQLLGWEPEPLGIHVPPDHLGLQWLTQGYLFSLCEQAQTRPDSQATRELAEMSARFLQRHLLWATACYRWVAQQASEPFYRHLATMSERFTEQLARQLAPAAD